MARTHTNKKNVRRATHGGRDQKNTLKPASTTNMGQNSKLVQ